MLCYVMYCNVSIVYTYIQVEYTTHRGPKAKIKEWGIMKMGKTMASMRIDTEVWEDLQRKFPQQLSQKVNDFLYRLHAYTKNDLVGLNVIEIEKKIDDLDQKSAKIHCEKDVLVEELLRLKQILSEKEAQVLEKEKAEAMSKVTCDICGVPKPNERVHNLPGGNVCNACYLSEPPQTLQKYMKIDKKKEKQNGGHTNGNNI